MWLMSHGNLVAADQKLLTLLNQDRSLYRLFDPGDVAELSEKLLVLLVA
jgi:hypothetical protein